VSILSVSVIFVGLAGVLMLTLGLRGRRVGDEPRCRKCRYNLTGIESINCPECGGSLRPRGVVRGIRRRRWMVAILGLLVLCGCGAMSLNRTRRFLATFDYYPYLPLRFVRAAAEKNVVNAMAVLRGRAQTGEIGRRNAEALAQIALAKQCGPSFGAFEAEWLSLMDDLQFARVLSDAIYQQYLRQAMQATLKVRTPVRAGDPLPILIDFHPREASSSRIQRTEKIVRASVNGDTLVVPPNDCGTPDCVCHGCRVTARGGTARPETQSFTVVLQRTATARGVTIAWEEQLREVVEIWPDDGPDPLTIIDDPEAMMQFQEFVAASAEYDQGDLQIHLRKALVRGSLVQLAAVFDVYLVDSDSTTAVGSLIAENGPILVEDLTAVGAGMISNGAYLELRSNVEAARCTTNLFKIWTGTAVINLEVGGPVPSPISSYSNTEFPITLR
jgi:hypothetical protein